MLRIVSTNRYISIPGSYTLPGILFSTGYKL